MALHIAYGGVLEESEVFEKTYDATLYNDDLYQYRSKKSIDLALAAIDALVEAGILEKTADGKVRMSERSYKIDLNNMRGRNAAFYKERGIVDPGLDNVYVPNPNLPVVTEEMIRQMIIKELAERKKRKKKKKKSKKRNYLYPYVFGYHYDHDHDSNDNIEFSFGADGGDGGGD
jgi:hypothetical protein